MKIVVLDADPAFGCARAPLEARGTLDVSELESVGDVAVFDLTGQQQVIERAQEARVIVTNKVALGEHELSNLPHLELISVLATGVNVIDLSAARKHGVTVCNVPGYSTMSTAQHTIALLLELTNHVGLHADDVARGGWTKARIFSYFRAPLRELDGLTLGVAGLGTIGMKVARMAEAFGMRILVNTRTIPSEIEWGFVDKRTLLTESDVVTLHFPLTKDTHHFIDEEALSWMKPDALLINASRGPVIDEGAVARALHEGRLGGMAGDVLSEEPPFADCPLLGAPRCIITPHIAWATEAARTRLLEATIQNIKAFVQGRPVNVVT